MTNQEIKSVNKILNGYTDKEETKLEKLKKLDKSTKIPARIFSYIFGIIGALVLGTGMCFAMQVITQLPMWAGVIIGSVGILMVSITYPIYKKMLKNARAKKSEEIIELSNEILNIKGEN